MSARLFVQDSVGVPVGVDDELGGADGHGASLVVILQVVFSQQDSVGATSILSQRKKEKRTQRLIFIS